MSEITRRQDESQQRWEWGLGSDLARWFEGVGSWFKDEDRLHVEQAVTGDSMIVRAEMPGIDPDRDVEITVADGVLHIRAERRAEKKEEKEGVTRWSSGMACSSGRCACPPVSRSTT